MVLQVFLDIVEQVNVLMNSKGSILRCDVNGKMIMKAYLSGMPEVKVGLNDRLEVWTFPASGLFRPAAQVHLSCHAQQ